ncbi:hypothetical protein [Candidatus Vidania fulgoroideorum]
MRHLKKKNYMYFKNKTKIKNLTLSLLLKNKIVLTKKISKILYIYVNKLLCSYYKKAGKRKNYINFLIKTHPCIKQIFIFKKTNYLRRKILKLRTGDMAKLYLLEIIN